MAEVARSEVTQSSYVPIPLRLASTAPQLHRWSPTRNATPDAPSSVISKRGKHCPYMTVGSSLGETYRRKLWREVAGRPRASSLEEGNSGRPRVLNMHFIAYLHISTHINYCQARSSAPKEHARGHRPVLPQLIDACIYFQRPRSTYQALFRKP